MKPRYAGTSGRTQGEAKDTRPAASAVTNKIGLSPKPGSTRCEYGTPPRAASKDWLRYSPESFRFSSVKLFHSSGTALSWKMAFTGHSGSHAPHSMHSSGLM